MIRSQSCRRISATLFFCFSLIPCSAQNQGQATNLRAHNVALERKVSAIYTKWLTEDVHWIITDQERTDFQKLRTDRSATILSSHFGRVAIRLRNPLETNSRKSTTGG